MAITGTHLLLYSSEPELRTVLRDAFGLHSVNAGHGWLIFALPPAELRIHPEKNAAPQVTFMCDDIVETVASLRSKGVCIDGEPQQQGIGITEMMTLPGGVEVMLYQPRHSVAIG